RSRSVLVSISTDYCSDGRQSPYPAPRATTLPDAPRVAARSGRSSSSLGVCSTLSTALPGSGQADHGKEHGGGPTDEGAPRKVVDGADVGDEFGCFLTTRPVGSLHGKIVGARDRLVEP